MKHYYVVLLRRRVVYYSTVVYYSPPLHSGTLSLWSLSRPLSSRTPRTPPGYTTSRRSQNTQNGPNRGSPRTQKWSKSDQNGQNHALWTKMDPQKCNRDPDLGPWSPNGPFWDPFGPPFGAHLGPPPEDPFGTSETHVHSTWYVGLG